MLAIFLIIMKFDIKFYVKSKWCSQYWMIPDPIHRHLQNFSQATNAISKKKKMPFKPWWHQQLALALALALQKPTHKNEDFFLIVNCNKNLRPAIINKSPLKTQPIVSCSNSLLYSLGVWVDPKLQVITKKQPSFFLKSSSSERWTGYNQRTTRCRIIHSWRNFYVHINTYTTCTILDQQIPERTQTWIHIHSDCCTSYNSPQTSSHV